MPLFYQQNINESTRLAVWEISEPEDFFLAKVPENKSVTHPHKRLQHLAGRYLLSWLYPDFPYAELAIADTRKPYLPDEQYHFSISHCGDYAAAIVSTQQRVGIDIETLTSRTLRIAHKFLHPEELRKLTGDETERIRTLTLLWSAKEALFKWWGRGAVDFSDMLRVDDLPTGSAGLLNARLIYNEMIVPLELEYKLLDKQSLVWVCGELQT